MSTNMSGIEEPKSAITIYKEILGLLSASVKSDEFEFDQLNLDDDKDFNEIFSEKLGQLDVFDNKMEIMFAQLHEMKNVMELENKYIHDSNKEAKEKCQTAGNSFKILINQIKDLRNRYDEHQKDMHPHSKKTHYTWKGVIDRLKYEKEQEHNAIRQKLLDELELRESELAYLQKRGSGYKAIVKAMCSDEVVIENRIKEINKEIESILEKPRLLDNVEQMLMKSENISKQVQEKFNVTHDYGSITSDIYFCRKGANSNQVMKQKAIKKEK